MTTEAKQKEELDLRKQMKATFEISLAIADTIRELKQIPSGHLYAQLMPYGISLDGYNALIDALKDANLITISNHLITWIGPDKPSHAQN